MSTKTQIRPQTKNKTPIEAMKVLHIGKTIESSNEAVGKLYLDMASLVVDFGPCEIGGVCNKRSVVSNL